jgi:hypothetical protein
MSKIVVATLNVSFGDEDSASSEGILKLEIDDREDGSNKGKTSFKPGDSVGYFLFKSTTPNVTVLDHVTTAGGFTGGSLAEKDVEENITFSNSDESTLGYPPSSAVEMSWLGRAFEIKDNSVSPITALPQRNGSVLSMGDRKVAGVLKCKYKAKGQLFTLSGVPADFPEAMIIAIGTT